MPKISVIIPMYNAQEFICDALVSVENQVLLPDEVLVVNDSSSDNSEQVVADYINRSKLNIRVLQNKGNKGPGGATNHGIKNASGEFIALLDADDKWLPDHLRQLEEAFKKNPGALVAFSGVKFFGDAELAGSNNAGFGISVRQCLLHAFEKSDDNIWLSNRNLFSHMLRNGFPFRCPAALIKNKLFIEQDLYFDEDVTYAQDALFMITAAFYTSFLYVDKTGLHIRKVSGEDDQKKYGIKISSSYERIFNKLRILFDNNKLDACEKKSLKICLRNLQADLFMMRAKNKNTAVTIKEGMKFFRKIPTLLTLKIIAKTVVKNSIQLFFHQKN